MSDRNSIDVDINFHVGEINEIFEKFMKEGGVDEKIFDKIGEKEGGLSDMLYQLQMEGDQSTLFANINELGAMMPIIKQLLDMAKATGETDEKELNILDSTERSIKTVIDLVKTLSKFLEEKVALTPDIQKELADALEIVNKGEGTFTERINLILQALKNTMVMSDRVGSDLLTPRSTFDTGLDDFQKSQMKYVMKDIENFFMAGLEALENIRERKAQGKVGLLEEDRKKLEELINILPSLTFGEGSIMNVMSDVLEGKIATLVENTNEFPRVAKGLSLMNAMLKNFEAIIFNLGEWINTIGNKISIDTDKIFAGQLELKEIAINTMALVKDIPASKGVAIINKKDINEIIDQLDHNTSEILNSLFTQNDLSEVGKALFQEMHDVGAIDVKGEEELKIARLTMIMNSMINTLSEAMDKILMDENIPEEIKNSIASIKVLKRTIPKRVASIMEKAGTESMMDRFIIPSDISENLEIVKGLLKGTLGALKEGIDATKLSAIADVTDQMVKRSQQIGLQGEEILTQLTIFNANLGVLDQLERDNMDMLTTAFSRLELTRKRLNQVVDGLKGNLDMVKNITNLDFE